jgi:hypothetical protein
MKQLLYLLTLLGLIVYFWQNPILYPFKLLVVFFHESSHALATLLTGGQVEEFVINAQQGGHVISRGGNRFITLSAGYLGSLLWGVIIYTSSVRSLYDKALTASLGGSIILMTVLLSSDLFSWFFGLISGAAMLIAARYLPNSFNDFFLRLLSLTSMLYVPLDIYSDTLSRSHLQSDAYMLAEHIGGTTVLWGGCWLIISLVVIFYCLKWSLIRDKMHRIQKF